MRLDLPRRSCHCRLGSMPTFQATYEQNRQADVGDCVVTLNMPPPATVHAGQLITFSVVPAIPEGDTAAAVSWAMDGAVADVIEVEGYEPQNVPQQPPPMPKVWPPPTPPTAEEAWHYLHPGVYTLELGLTAVCPDGEEGSAQGTFELTVVAPAIDASVIAEPVSVEQTETPAGNPLFLYRPGALPASPGLSGYIMEFTLNPPAEAALPGSVIVVQTMSANRAHTYADGSQNVLVTQGFALDNEYPYEPPEDFPALEPLKLAVSDAPTDTFLLNPENLTTETTLDEHYEMYVLFQPEDDENDPTIPVPLGKFPWQWTGGATYANGQLNPQTTVSADPPGGPDFVTPCEAPFWTELLENGVPWNAIPAPPPAPPPPPDEPPPLADDGHAFGPPESLPQSD